MRTSPNPYILARPEFLRTTGAVTEADQLLRDVMSSRGYPVADFEQRAADVSVDHPLVINNYRGAHEIALRQTR
jgi:hypothetical protein